MNEQKRGGRELYLHKCFSGLGPGILSGSSEDRFSVAAGAGLMTDMVVSSTQAVREVLGYFTALQIGSVLLLYVNYPNVLLQCYFHYYVNFPYPFYLLLKETHM